MFSLAEADAHELPRAYTLFNKESPLCYEVLKTGSTFFDETYTDQCVKNYGLAGYLRDNTKNHKPFVLQRVKDKGCEELMKAAGQVPVPLGRDAYYKNFVKAFATKAQIDNAAAWAPLVGKWANAVCANSCSASCIVPGAGSAPGGFYKETDVPACNSTQFPAVNAIPDWNSTAATAFNASTYTTNVWTAACKVDFPVLERAYTLYAEKSPFCYDIMKTGSTFFDETYSNHCLNNNGLAAYIRDNNDNWKFSTMQKSDISCAELMKNKTKMFPVPLGQDKYYKNAAFAYAQQEAFDTIPAWAPLVGKWLAAKCADPCTASCINNDAGLGVFYTEAIPACKGVSEWIPNFYVNPGFDATSGIDTNWKTCAGFLPTTTKAPDASVVAPTNPTTTKPNQDASDASQTKVMPQTVAVIFAASILRYYSY